MAEDLSKMIRKLLAEARRYPMGPHSGGKVPMPGSLFGYAYERKDELMVAHVDGREILYHFDTDKTYLVVEGTIVHTEEFNPPSDKPSIKHTYDEDGNMVEIVLKNHDLIIVYHVIPKHEQEPIQDHIEQMEPGYKIHFRKRFAEYLAMMDKKDQ